MKTLKVIGGPNGPVLREGMPRKLDESGRDMNAIHSGEKAEVESTRYYRRRLDAGDLLSDTEKPAAPAKKAKE